MIVGGYAVVFHGYPRFTKDIDIFFEYSPDNVARLRAALVDFGFSRRTFLKKHSLPRGIFSVSVCRRVALTFSMISTRYRM